MIALAFLIVAALAFVAGTCWENGRRGGSADLREFVAVLEEQLAAAVLAPDVSTPTRKPRQRPSPLRSVQ